MQRLLLTLALACLASPLLAADAAPAGDGQCEANFTVSGSFGSGKTYKTSVEYHGLAYDTVFDKFAAAIAADGLNIIDQSKERGYIRANNPVTGGQGGTAVAPLRVLVLGRPDGNVKVDASFQTAGGQFATRKSIMTHMCTMFAAPLR